MRQVIRKGIKDIVVDEVPAPELSAHHVLVRPVRSLISSGTETASIHQDGVLKEVSENPSHIRRVLATMQAQGPARTISEVMAKLYTEYAVLGYAGAGVVAAKHSTVTDLEIGQPVAYGGEGTGHGEIISTGRQLVARIPEDLSFDEACFSTLGSIALNAVRIAQIGLGETVVVVGLGLVGQLVAQLVRLQGGRVIATDLRADRVALAQQLGADHGVPGGGTFRETVLELTHGRGADCVIIAAAAKSSVPCQIALQVCRDRGRIVVLGAVEMSFPWHEMYLKEIQLFMSRAYGPGSYDPAYERQGHDYPLPYVRWTENRNMEEFLRLCRQGRVDVRKLVTHRFALDKAPEAYQTILDPAANSLAVLLEYPALEPAAPPPLGRKIAIAGAAPHAGKIGVALAGAGGLARWTHLPNLAKVPGAELRAIHSSNGARAKSYAQRFKAAFCTTSFDELIADPSVGAVIITSRNQHHARQAVAALGAGKHVFVEKPMALTEQECLDIQQAVRDSGAHLSVGFNRRFAPDYVNLKRQLSRRSGPAVLNCRINSPGISGSYWMADPAIGGAILGEACHFVDLMFWLLDSEPVEVSATSLPTGKTDPIGQNNMVAQFRFADGSIGSLTYCTVGSKTSGGERVEAFAPGLGAYTENFQLLVTQTGLSRRSRRWFPEKGYAAQLNSFFSTITQGGAQAVTVDDGVRSTIGCLRMLDSARERRPFPLAWSPLA